MNTIEQDAADWLRKNRSKNKNIGAKVQRAQIAGVILSTLIPLSRTGNKMELIKEAYEWADLLLENA